MRAISLMRFNALAGYCRQPQSVLFSEELGWYEDGGERVLGTLIRDQVDADFGGIALGRDRKGRFRAVGLAGWHPAREGAEVALGVEMARLAAAPDAECYQDDEQGSPLDFFAPRVPRDRLSAGFVKLAEDEGFSPARGIVEPMMCWYEDPDGNFVEQFQTSGFNARIWELYLFAAFVEMGYRIDRTHATPDFRCVGILGDLHVEAVTVGPTRDASGAIVPPPPLDTPEGELMFRREYMPIKYGSPLTSKLAKRYWDLPHVTDKPLVFAIHDFHAPLSMLVSRSALPVYLYGYDEDWEHDKDGRLQIHPRKVETHRWREKVIPSGFFALPEAENVSAVLFSNSGTISRFDRMGLLAGFGSARVRLVREGYVLDHDPNASKPRPFRRIVNAPDYTETWVEGLEVFHNPRATCPIEPSMLPGAAHHHVLPGGRTETLAPDWHPLSSVTHVLVANRE